MDTLEPAMARPKPKADEPPIGPILTENLIRLGYSRVVVETTEIARLVTERTGKPMSRQRISSLLNAVRINPDTLDLLGQALGVSTAELIRRPKKVKPKGRRKS